MPIAPASPSAASVSSDGLDKKLLQLRQPRFGGAGFLREIEELVAMVECEREHLVVHAARGAVTRCSRVSVASWSGRGMLRGVGEKIIELDARRHRRRAAVARDDQRAAGVGVAAARVVVLAAHPARQESRRERVARAEHVEHFDVDAACR